MRRAGGPFFVLLAISGAFVPGPWVDAQSPTAGFPITYDRLLNAHEEPGNWLMYGGDYRKVAPLTSAVVERWYEQLCADPLQWAIEADGWCIGTAQLHHLDEQNRRARYAIGIFNAAYWGQGIGTEATRLVLQYAFDDLHLHRVDLRVLTYNHRAIKCYEKCAFVREGIERESALVAGEWHGDLIMGILEQEYREVSKTWWDRPDSTPTMDQPST